MICYDYINEYIRGTIKRSDGILKDMEEYAKINRIPIIHPEVARFLTVLGRIKKPKFILEIGTAIGYSALVMSEILQDGGRIDTIEKDENLLEKASDNIRKLNLGDRINLMQGDARVLLDQVNGRYDMLFIDASKGHYMEFLKSSLGKLNEGAVIVSDNVLYKGMVSNDDIVVKRKKTIVKRLREYLDFICNCDLLDTTIITIGDGVAVSYYLGDNRR